ncbi:MAG: PKD domain-containing protein [Ardenticatenaceae bacterium]|nr:PKD domain-containing protein [Ardenticatenaceae bacterium]
MSTPLVSTEPGSYTVTLTVNSDGGTMSKTVVDYITVTLGAPVANFSTTPISGTVPLTVTLTDLSTGQPTSWGWDFGDGATATAQHPNHTYSAAGTYTVTLTVSNTVGSDTATGTVTVLNSVADTAKVVRRISYRFGGQVVATRVVAEDAQGQLIDNPAFTGLFYVHGDHLGSATALSYGQDRPTLQGTLVPDSVARFLPFGGYRGAKPQTNPAVSDRGFTGHKHNNYIKLVDMRARWYAPEIGRFISPDTIVPDPMNPQSFNRYSYSYNNPIKYSDPTGHCSEVRMGTDDDEYFVRVPSDSQCWFYYDSIIDLMEYNPGYADAIGWNNGETSDSSEYARKGKGELRTLWQLHRKHASQPQACWGSGGSAACNRAKFSDAFNLDEATPDAFLIGGSGSVGFIDAFTSGGELLFSSDGVAGFAYDGTGWNTPTPEASIEPFYGGAVWNLPRLSDYSGDFWALNVYATIGTGAELTIFGAPGALPFSSQREGTWGIAIKPAAGYGVGGSYFETNYREWFSVPFPWLIP